MLEYDWLQVGSVSADRALVTRADGLHGPGCVQELWPGVFARTLAGTLAGTLAVNLDITLVAYKPTSRPYQEVGSHDRVLLEHGLTCGDQAGIRCRIGGSVLWTPLSQLLAGAAVFVTAKPRRVSSAYLLGLSLSSDRSVHLTHQPAHCALVA
jgi:hypothetical protein